MLDNDTGIKRGDTVRVTEPGLRSFAGKVLNVKLSSRTGWWIDVRMDAGGVWSVPAGMVTKEGGEQPRSTTADTATGS